MCVSNVQVLGANQRSGRCSLVEATLVLLARLLRRVFEIDMAHCQNCGGELTIMAAILEQPVIEQILTPLELQAWAPPRVPARGQALQAA